MKNLLTISFNFILALWALELSASAPSASLHFPSTPIASTPGDYVIPVFFNEDGTPNHANIIAEAKLAAKENRESHFIPSIVAKLAEKLASVVKGKDSTKVRIALIMTNDHFQNAAWHAAWDAAWSGTVDNDDAVAGDATWYASRESAWSTARDSAWSTARDSACAWNAAKDAGWRAADDAARSIVAWGDAWAAARASAKDATTRDDAWAAASIATRRQVAFRVAESISILHLADHTYIGRIFNAFYNALTCPLSKEVAKLASYEHWVKMHKKYKALKPEAQLFLKPWMDAIQKAGRAEQEFERGTRRDLLYILFSQLGLESINRARFEKYFEQRHKERIYPYPALEKRPLEP